MTIVDKIIDSIKASQADGFEVYYHDEPTLQTLITQLSRPGSRD